jgi:hypothetical protein
MKLLYLSGVADAVLKFILMYSAFRAAAAASTFSDASAGSAAEEARQNHGTTRLITIRMIGCVPPFIYILLVNIYNQ